MRSLSLLVASLSLVAAVAGCHPRTSYHYHTEPPLESEVSLTPERNMVVLRAELEPHWPDGPRVDDGSWQVSDQLYASFRLRWINLGPDPAPSVVEVQGLGPTPVAATAVIVEPNEDGSTSISTSFDYERCGTPCVVEVALTWHHAPSGELRVGWSASASRSASREDPSTSYSLGYHVAPSEARFGGRALEVAAGPGADATEPLGEQVTATPVVAGSVAGEPAMDGPTADEAAVGEGAAVAHGGSGAT